MKQNLNKMWEGEEIIKGLSVGCVGRERKWIAECCRGYYMYCCLLNAVRNRI